MDVGVQVNTSSQRQWASRLQLPQAALVSLTITPPSEAPGSDVNFSRKTAEVCPLAASFSGHPAYYK